MKIMTALLSAMLVRTGQAIVTFWSTSCTTQVSDLFHTVIKMLQYYTFYNQIFHEPDNLTNPTSFNIFVQLKLYYKSCQFRFNHATNWFEFFKLTQDMSYALNLQHSTFYLTENLPS